MISKQIIINIDGMKCIHCAKKVEDSLKNIENIKSVKVNLDKNNAIIKYKDTVDIDLIKKNIEELDYKFIGVEK